MKSLNPSGTDWSCFAKKRKSGKQDVCSLPQDQISFKEEQITKPVLTIAGFFQSPIVTDFCTVLLYENSVNCKRLTEHSGDVFHFYLQFYVPFMFSFLHIHTASHPVFKYTHGDLPPLSLFHCLLCFILAACLMNPNYNVQKTQNAPCVFFHPWLCFFKQQASHV